mmetsp:Transcript_87374/g.232839  ORF Transcript_87374/g.232839 Transcript_87374/m.232839 type:complete len:82 (+) Transcript_87374:73-318(+)
MKKNFLRDRIHFAAMCSRNQLLKSLTFIQPFTKKKLTGEVAARKKVAEVIQVHIRSRSADLITKPAQVCLSFETLGFESYW